MEFGSDLPPGLLFHTGSRPNQLIQDWKIGDILLFGLDGPHHMPSSDLPSPPVTNLPNMYTIY